MITYYGTKAGSASNRLGNFKPQGAFFTPGILHVSKSLSGHFQVSHDGSGSLAHIHITQSFLQ